MPSYFSCLRDPFYLAANGNKLERLHLLPHHTCKTVEDQIHLIRQASEIIKDSNIFTLCISHSFATDELITEVIELLKKNGKFSKLNFINNSLTDKGAIKLLEGLKDTNIFSVNLEDNEITNQGVREIFKILPKTKISCLSLADNQNIDVKDFFSEISNMVANTKLTGLSPMMLRLKAMSKLTENSEKQKESIMKFKAIVLSDKNEFKDPSEIEENQKKELLKIIKKYGVNAVAEHIVKYFTSDNNIHDLSCREKIAEIANAVKNDLCSKTTIINKDREIVLDLAPYLSIEDPLCVSSKLLSFNDENPSLLLGDTPPPLPEDLS